MGCVNAGQLDELLIIERATESRDDEGGVTEAWTSQGTRWAHVEDLFGRELERARLIESTTTHRVTIRTFDDLNPGDRFRDSGGTRVLNIVAVLRPDGARTMTQSVLCKRLDPVEVD